MGLRTPSYFMGVFMLRFFMKEFIDFFRSLLIGCIWFGGFWFWLKVMQILLGDFVFFSLVFVIVLLLVLSILIDLHISKGRAYVNK